MTTVDVVILTWNDGPLLQRAVTSVQAQTVDTRVVVVDNGSEPPAKLARDDHTVLFRNSENRGVAAGRNQGVRAGGSSLVCLLDSDAHLGADALKKLVDVLEQDPTIGLVGPVFDGQRPEESGGLAPGACRKLARATGLTSTYRRARGSTAAGAWDVDFVIGACQVFRRSIFDAVGGLDERYFYGPEDLDFCLRIKASGSRVVQVDGPVVFHPPRRRNRRLLTVRGLRHAAAVGQHLWRSRGWHRTAP